MHNKCILLTSRKGTSIVIFALVFTVIATICALTVDIGSIIVEKSRLSATIDAAALAGAQELVSSTGNAETVAREYIQSNIGTLDDIEVNISNNELWIEVSGSKDVDSFFSKLIGYDYHHISALARAKVENIKSIKGARPLAIIQQDFVYGQTYTLKEGAGDGISGNYAAISLGGTGTSIYRDNLLNGYSGTITYNDKIETETGNMSGTTETSITQLITRCNHTPPCTYDSYNPSCSRIIYVPVVNTLDINGRKYVNVLGFATFFLEGVNDNGGHAEIIGKFINSFNTTGETSSEINDYGTYGIRLTK